MKKWSHSLVEVDLAWSTATEPLDAAVTALAEQGDNSRLRSVLGRKCKQVENNPIHQTI